ncbi:MAG: hypothetical protein JJ866_07490 [Roseibium sp.]|uniref:LIC10280 family protein n=1 Tax=Roseibium sp. TaxID=1936156 RepID=UPI001B176E1F|nr:hypothetical protein [Roseibium sp.]MBO6891766.1 hypothetical protein [Roseibium sp.]MBO6932964.1 hypothetical protein [Roseibium sp.]
MGRTAAMKLTSLLKALLPALLLACVAAPLMIAGPGTSHAAPKAAFAPQIEGVYSVQGLNPNGTRYQGRVNIAVKDGTAFFKWDIAGQTFHGQGPLNGTRLVIDWGEEHPVIYQINQDGTLFGTWAAGRASETLRPLN